MLRGKITLRGQEMARLASLLTNALHKIVVDESGMTGHYDFDLPYQPGQPQVLINALAKLGLELTKTTKKVKVLVVEPAA